MRPSQPIRRPAAAHEISAPTGWTVTVHGGAGHQSSSAGLGHARNKRVGGMSSLPAHAAVDLIDIWSLDQRPGVKLA